MPTTIAVVILLIRFCFPLLNVRDHRAAAVDRPLANRLSAAPGGSRDRSLDCQSRAWIGCSNGTLTGLDLLLSSAIKSCFVSMVTNAVFGDLLRPIAQPYSCRNLNHTNRCSFPFPNSARHRVSQYRSSAQPGPNLPWSAGTPIIAASDIALQTAPCINPNSPDDFPRIGTRCAPAP